MLKGRERLADVLNERRGFKFGCVRVLMMSKKEAPSNLGKLNLWGTHPGRCTKSPGDGNDWLRQGKGGVALKDEDR